MIDFIGTALLIIGMGCIFLIPMLLQKIKYQFIFKWFDFWIGLFWDSKKQWLYILPIPMFGVIIKFNPVFRTWMDQLKVIAETAMPTMYRKGDEWAESYFKTQFFDKGLTPQQAWTEYTRDVR